MSKMQDRFKFNAWDKKHKKMYYEVQNGLYALSFSDLLENDNFEIIQSTGLKDKNGKLIYEGVIVKTNYGDVGVIKYSTHFCRWQIIFKQGREHLLAYKEIGVHVFDFIYPKMHLEIIGNIYENPELLETKNE